MIRTSSSSAQCRTALRYAASSRLIRSHALNVGAGSGGYEERQDNDSERHTETSSKTYVVFASDYKEVQITDRNFRSAEKCCKWSSMLYCYNVLVRFILVMNTCKLKLL